MKLLAVETSSAIGSVALLEGTDVAERFIATPREQTDLVLALVDDLLGAGGMRLADLDAVVFGRGPGSFTGLRIAAAVAQGLATAADRPVAAVSSLQALAQRAWRELGIGDALLAVDARMNEVYWAHYVVRSGRARLRGDERLGPADTVEAPGEGFAAVGNGWTAYPEAFAGLLERAERAVPDLVPSARDLLVQAVDDVAGGRVLAPEAALPVYLRDEAAWRR